MKTKNHTPTTGQCPSCGNYCNLKKDLDEKDYCNDCRPSTPNSRLGDELEKFRNGEERYSSDSIFKQALDSLTAGVGVYAVLDSILRRLSHQVEVANKLREENKTLTEKLKKYENI